MADILVDLFNVAVIFVPFIIALVLLVFFKWKADIAGLLTWIMISIVAIIFFHTDILVILLSSLAGILDSFKIALMVLFSILMITLMQKTGALKRLIIFFKTIRGGGNKAFQIMFLNLGLGCFLVSIGATPVSILPPVMIALGYSPVAAVALPAIGYDPLTTFALLSIPALAFFDVITGLGVSATFPQTGLAFAIFMPVVTTGIAFGMLFIGGGKKLVLNREAAFLAVVSGLTAGFISILSNIAGMVTLTGVFAGIGVIIMLILYCKIRGYNLIDRSVLTAEEEEFCNEMSLIRAMLPWIVLVFLCLVTNVIPPIFTLLFKTWEFPLTISGITIKMRFLWQAYTWVVVATVISVVILWPSRQELKDTVNTWLKRAPRPTLAAAIFFAVAFVINHSGTVIGNDGTWITNPELNMVFSLASFTAVTLGVLYPLAVPFIGLFGGFVSGSEYHYETSLKLSMDPLLLGAVNGIGGGLASVLSPAKIQNAAAVIDKIGIEGEIIRKTGFIAILMTAVVSIMAFILVII